MLKRQLGLGTVSLLLAFIGLAWGFTLNSGMCIGDNVLNYIGLKAWSNGNTGTHLTLAYSLLFSVPAFLLATKHKEHFGAKAGRIISLIMIPLGLVVFILGIIIIN